MNENNLTKIGQSYCFTIMTVKNEMNDIPSSKITERAGRFYNIVSMTK